jgi:hypothetical protein
VQTQLASQYAQLLVQRLLALAVIQAQDIFRIRRLEVVQRERQRPVVGRGARQHARRSLPSLPRAYVISGGGGCGGFAGVGGGRQQDSVQHL